MTSLRDGTRYLVCATDRHAEWCLNLVASPQVTQEVRAGKPIATRAVPLEGEERDRARERLRVARTDAHPEQLR